MAADVAEFNRRFASDEFAGKISNLSGARATSSSETKQPTWLVLDSLSRVSPPTRYKALLLKKIQTMN